MGGCGTYTWVADISSVDLLVPPEGWLAMYCYAMFLRFCPLGVSRLYALDVSVELYVFGMVGAGGDAVH